MAKTKTDFECLACGYESPKWYGRCPNCGAWNQMEESIVHKEQKAKDRGTLGKVSNEKTKARQLSKVNNKITLRTHEKSDEFDCVLGGDIVDGWHFLCDGFL